MLLHDFADRAEECLRLAEVSPSSHDRELFVELARAWYGIDDEIPQMVTAPKMIGGPKRLH